MSGVTNVQDWLKEERATYKPNESALQPEVERQREGLAQMGHSPNGPNLASDREERHRVGMMGQPPQGNVTTAPDMGADRLTQRRESDIDRLYRLSNQVHGCSYTHDEDF